MYAFVDVVNGLQGCGWFCLERTWGRKYTVTVYEWSSPTAWTSSDVECEATDGTTNYVRAAGGDAVTAGVAFVPEVMYNGQWSPICGHYFWDNNNGAATVCEALGFSGGTHQQTRTTYSTDAMPVGECSAGQALNSCTDGGNAWGNFEWDNGGCKAGTEVGITVTCGAEHTCMWRQTGSCRSDAANESHNMINSVTLESSETCQVTVTAMATMPWRTTRKAMTAARLHTMGATLYAMPMLADRSQKRQMQEK